jgi:hypothetical protein
MGLIHEGKKIMANLALCLLAIKYHIMKAYGGVEI